MNYGKSGVAAKHIWGVLSRVQSECGFAPSMYRGLMYHLHQGTKLKEESSRISWWQQKSASHLNIPGGGGWRLMYVQHSTIKNIYIKHINLKHIKPPRHNTRPLSRLQVAFHILSTQFIILTHGKIVKLITSDLILDHRCYFSPRTILIYTIKSSQVARST